MVDDDLKVWMQPCVRGWVGVCSGSCQVFGFGELEVPLVAVSYGSPMPVVLLSRWRLWSPSLRRVDFEGRSGLVSCEVEAVPCAVLVDSV